MRLLASVLDQLPKTNKAQRLFVSTVLEVMLLVPGPCSFRNLSRYSAYAERTFARGFSRSLDWVALNQRAIEQVLPATHEQALVLDASFIPKSGKHTYGRDRFWHGTAGRAARGLEISVLAWLDLTANQAYSLSVAQTPPVAPDCPKAKGDESRLAAYLAQLRGVVESYQLQHLKYLITDAYYSKTPFLDGVRALELHQIGKLRGDANMRYLYTGPKRSGPGAPRQYDGKVAWAD